MTGERGSLAHDEHLEALRKAEMERFASHILGGDRPHTHRWMNV